AAAIDIVHDGIVTVAWIHVEVLGRFEHDETSEWIDVGIGAGEELTELGRLDTADAALAGKAERERLAQKIDGIRRRPAAVDDAVADAGIETARPGLRIPPVEGRIELAAGGLVAEPNAVVGDVVVQDQGRDRTRFDGDAIGLVVVDVALENLRTQRPV